MSTNVRYVYNTMGYDEGFTRIEGLLKCTESGVKSNEMNIQVCGWMMKNILAGKKEHTNSNNFKYLRIFYVKVANKRLKLWNSLERMLLENRARERHTE